MESVLDRQVVREACKALAAMPLLVAQPVCTMVSLLLLYCWTAIITMYFMSAGEFDMTTGTFVYSVWYACHAPCERNFSFTGQK